jgi:ADP-heptose:LPS heptosyltransferase
MDSGNEKLLAINFGGIGDEILFLPTLKSLKERFPNTHLTLLLEPRSQSVKDLTDVVDEVITFDIKKRPLLASDLLALLHLIKSGNHQTVVSSGSSPLVAVLLFLSGIKTRVAYDSGFFSRMLLTKAVRLNRNQYAANMYHDLVQGLGLPVADVVPQISVNKTSLNCLTDFLKSAEEKANRAGCQRVLIHPGTSLLALKKGIIKTWSAERWAELIGKLAKHPELQVILAGGPDDAIVISELTETAQQRLNAKPWISALGATKSLSDLAALIELSDLLICVDSAPMHVAVALGKPTVALFGPTDHGKLLPSDPRFKALVGSPTGKISASDGPGVQLQPDTVYQCALDQLRQSKSPAHLPGSVP